MSVTSVISIVKPSVAAVRSTNGNIDSMNRGMGRRANNGMGGSKSVSNDSMNNGVGGIITQSYITSHTHA